MNHITCSLNLTFKMNIVCLKLDSLYALLNGIILRDESQTIRNRPLPQAHLPALLNEKQFFAELIELPYFPEFYFFLYFTETENF